eukprot:2443657-Pyramimonas_sp.AAC.1
MQRTGALQRRPPCAGCELQRDASIRRRRAAQNPCIPRRAHAQAHLRTLLQRCVGTRRDTRAQRCVGTRARRGV